MSDCCELDVVISDDEIVIVDETSDLVVITDAEMLTILDSDVDVTVIDTPEYVVINDGLPGPPGPPGPSGSKFIYVQSTPTATWIVPHNLNGYVDVTILNAANTIVEADVVETDLNTATVMFSLPQSGIAIVS